MIYSKNNLGIVIASKKPSASLFKTLMSIKQSSTKPSQVIIVFPKLINTKTLKKNFPNFIFLNSKFANQVHQRTQGIKHLHKRILISLHLDDRVLLYKNTIKELISIWNKSSSNTAGIGLNPIGQVRPQPNLFHKLTYTNEDKDSYILKNGYCTSWNELKNNDMKANWLNGGMTSWRLKKLKKLKSRKYPLISWCVAEDLIFSYEVSKKFTLLISKNARAKYIKKNENITIKSNFLKGFYHSKIIHSFVIFEKKFSYLLYLYSTVSSSLIGFTLSLFRLDINNAARFIGRFLGIISFYGKEKFK